MGKNKSRENKYSYISSQLLNFAEDSYFERTSRPVYAIVFLLPFIAFYELGTIFINTDVLNHTQVRVVAFTWLQSFLVYLGFGSKLAWAAPAFAVVIILAALQIASRKQWRFGIGDIGPMAVECTLLAVPLIVLSLFLNTSRTYKGDAEQFYSGSAQLQVEIITAESVAEYSDDEGQEQSVLANIVTGIGAGIYEELLFRLILICALMVLFQNVLQFSHKNSIIMSILISAALFSVHHHIVFIDGQLTLGSPFNWMEFSFRTIAGVYLAVLFAIRGFGITAGTHGFYDIIATVINSVFFQQ